MKPFTSRNAFWLLLIVACVTLLPFLGLADFHTKGEPREAVVAYSMLDSDDWVLPRNNGGEIPYKPPFFHWTVAAASVLTGGTVSEFSSRLPSALALIAMTMFGMVFYSRRKGTQVGFLASLVTLTAFELHRAGANCRVDMVLTALTVSTLYLFYRYYERGLKGVPWLAILLMSCATLTKGPVGSLIPCLAFGVFLLLRGVNFFRAFLLLAAWGLASFILPLCWYYAAWLQGGQEFLDLVMEENFGRMTNTMSYDSCVNPWHYNFLTLAGGYVPWILLALFSLFSLGKIRRGLVGLVEQDGSPSLGSDTLQPDARLSGLAGRLSGWWRGLTAWIKDADPVDLFSAVCIFVIFLFYCFPQSKRSVYLMPIYPFIAYFLARYMIYLVKVKSRAVKVYGTVLAVLSILLTAAFLMVKYGMVPTTVFHGRHAAQNIAMMESLASLKGLAALPACVPPFLGMAWFFYLYYRRRYTAGYLYAICALTFGLYFALDGAYQPRVLEAKSQRPVAMDIDAIAPASSGTIYEFIEEGELAAGDPVHFFELNFYLGDRIENFVKNKPSEGYLLITDVDADNYLPRFEQEGYTFTHLYDSSRPVLRRTARLYRFSRR